MMSVRETTNLTTVREPARVNRIGPASLAYGPDGRGFVIGNWDRTALACDGKECRPLGNAPSGGVGGFVPADASAPRISYSPDGRTVALSWSRGPVTFWDLEQGRAAPTPLPGSAKEEDQPALFEYGSGATVAWSDAAGRIFLRDGARTKILDPERSERTRTAGVPVGLSFSPNGDRLVTLRVTANGVTRVALWDARSGSLVGRLPDITVAVGATGFSRGGDLLAVGVGEDVLLWDIAARRPLSERLRGHGSPVTSLSFSPDGRTLVTGAGEIIVWDVSTDGWIARACRMANRDLSPQEWSDLTETPYQPACPGPNRTPELRPSNERAVAPRS
jgi:WD40 repeat protein